MRLPLLVESPFHPTLLKQSFQRLSLNEAQFDRKFLLLKEFLIINHLTKSKIVEINLFFFQENFIKLFGRYQITNY